MLRTSLSRTTQRPFKRQALERTTGCFQTRLYATEVPWARPPYRPAPTEQPPAETFSSPSKPRQYYARPAPKRELPSIEVLNSAFANLIRPQVDDSFILWQRRWPALVILGTLGVAAWVAFIKYANNQERLTSSITQQILQNLRDSPEVNELLGDAIRPEPVWYLNGDPWVDGVVRSRHYCVFFAALMLRE